MSGVEGLSVVINPDHPEQFIQKAKRLVQMYFNERVDKSDGFGITEDDVYVVWFNKTLQHWKCLLSTNVPDGMYYELTHNGDKHETYIDAYKKFDNQCVKDEGVLF